MDNSTVELEKFLSWFSDLEEIPVYTRRDFVAHVIEIGGIDEKAAKFIDDTLEHLEDNQNRQIRNLEGLNGTLKFLGESVSEMNEKDVFHAEAEMQRIADKYCDDFRKAEMIANKKAEAGAMGEDVKKAGEARGEI